MSVRKAPLDGSIALLSGAYRTTRAPNGVRLAESPQKESTIHAIFSWIFFHPIIKIQNLPSTSRFVTVFNVVVIQKPI